MRINVPKSVVCATTLLLATHAAGLWEMILLSRTLGVPLWMPYSVLAFVYSLVLFLLLLLLRGKSWARVVCTVFGILNLLSASQHIAALGVAGWLVATAKAIALMLLYAPASNAWFAGYRLGDSSKPKLGSSA